MREQMKNYNEIERQRGVVHAFVDAMDDAEAQRECLNNIRKQIAEIQDFYKENGYTSEREFDLVARLERMSDGVVMLLKRVDGLELDGLKVKEVPHD